MQNKHHYNKTDEGLDKTSRSENLRFPESSVDNISEIYFREIGKRDLPLIGQTGGAPEIVASCTAESAYRQVFSENHHSSLATHHYRQP